MTVIKTIVGAIIIFFGLLALAGAMEKPHDPPANAYTPNVYPSNQPSPISPGNAGVPSSSPPDPPVQTYESAPKPNTYSHNDWPANSGSIYSSSSNYEIPGPSPWMDSIREQWRIEDLEQKVERMEREQFQKELSCNPILSC